MPRSLRLLVVLVGGVLTGVTFTIWGLTRMTPSLVYGRTGDRSIIDRDDECHHHLACAPATTTPPTTSTTVPERVIW